MGQARSMPTHGVTLTGVHVLTLRSTVGRASRRDAKGLLLRSPLAAVAWNGLTWLAQAEPRVSGAPKAGASSRTIAAHTGSWTSPAADFRSPAALESGQLQTNGQPSRLDAQLRILIPTCGSRRPPERTAIRRPTSFRWVEPGVGRRPSSGSEPSRRPAVRRGL